MIKVQDFILRYLYLAGQYVCLIAMRVCQDSQIANLYFEGFINHIHVVLIHLI